MSIHLIKPYFKRFRMSLQILKFAWPDVASTASSIVPPFDASSHKGSMGRIGVIGGSQDYCGAPYYAAVSALKFGADLSWVYCSQEAAIPIKSYSPELMVTPFYEDNQMLNVEKESTRRKMDMIQASANKVISSFPRLHTLLVGPGLGRNSNVLSVVSDVILAARENNIPMVIDADGLFLVTSNLHVVMGCTNCILTPNAPEFERLASAVTAYYHETTTSSSGVSDSREGGVAYWLAELGCSTADTGTSTTTTTTSTTAVATPLTPLEEVQARRVYALSTLLGGVTVLHKGAVDTIASSSSAMDNDTDTGTSGGAEQCAGNHTAYVLQGRGSPRRCGGLGDILSGTVAAALHWATATATARQQRSSPLPDLVTALSSSTMSTSTLTTSTTHPTSSHTALIHACVLASAVSKRAAELAFAAKGRAMTAPDVIERIGEAFVLTTGAQ